MDVLDNLDLHNNQIFNAFLQGTAKKVSSSLTIKTKNKLKGTFDGSQGVSINIIPKDLDLPDSFEFDDGEKINRDSRNVLIIPRVRGPIGPQGVQGIQGLQGLQGLKGVLNEATYTNETPMPTTLGGLKKGTIFNEMNYVELLDRLLYPYVLPKVSLTSSISPGYFEIGYSIPNINLVTNIVLGSNRITNLYLYGVKSDPINIPTPGNPTNYQIQNLANTAKYYVEILDENTGEGGNRVKSNELEFIFVRPVFYGLASIKPTSDNLDEIISNSDYIVKKAMGKGEIRYTSPAFDSKYYFLAVPEDGWELNSAIDSNGFDNTLMFKENHLVGSITEIDEQQVSYNVYFSDLTSQSNSFTFKYNFI